MLIYLCPNLTTPARVDAAKQAVGCLERQGNADVRMSAANSRALFGNDARSGDPAKADLIVSVGGDGSVLRAAQIAVGVDRPLLGVNSGRLGFLCALEISELPALRLSALTSMPYEERTMLSITLDGSTRLALNDVVIARRRLAGTLSATVSNEERTLFSFRGDGLIIATPTGSTAYSRSAGGPVLLPDTGCFSLTPICAHTPGTAPLVVSDSKAYRVEVTDCGGDAADVLADGATIGSVTAPLTIEKHHRALRLLRRPYS